MRRCTCRNRSTTVTAVPPSMRHSARVYDGSDPSPYPSGITTPNCQRLRFFCAEARYG